MIRSVFVLLLLLLFPTGAFASEIEPAVHSATSLSPAAMIAMAIFVLGYLGITLEHRYPFHKSALALITGVSVWIVAAAASRGSHIIEETLHNTGAEIFEIIAFLLCAMGLVEILVHYRFFDMIRVKLMKLNFDDHKQFLVISYLTFFLSAILDNLTVTIVMTQIAMRFFKNKHNLLVMVANIVIMANAGGAWSPIGDVTTIMLWLAQKFSSMNIIIEGFIPSFVLGTVATFMLSRKVVKNGGDIVEETNIHFRRGAKIIIGIAMASFLLPLAAHSIGLRPYQGLLLGLGLVWSAIEFLKTYSKAPTYLDTNIEAILQKVDISSLQFFIGILLAVSGLQVLGVLDYFSAIILGEAQEPSRIIVGNIVLGLLSAIVDNVPLTALAIDIIKVQEPALWVLLALTVGTGGSVLIIGSVSGIVAMGMVKELRFDRYLKIASIPALVAYAVGCGVWYIQYLLFLK